MSHDVYDLRLGIMGRWIIVHPQEESLAWSGSRWDSHYKGVATGEAQIANFDSPNELHRYALENLERIRAATETTRTPTNESTHE